MKFQAIDEQRKHYSLRIMCKALRVSTRGYYSWKKSLANRKTSDSELLRNIQKIHIDSRKTYGSPRIHAKLKKNGYTCSRKKVERLMRGAGIRSKIKRKFKATTNSKHKLPIATNILNREFSSVKKDQKLCADITYIWTGEGWLYLACVLDLYSRRIVGWSMGSRISKELVINAFKMAMQHRNPSANFVMHSDRGSQYASSDYQKLLKLFNATCSMSRKGNCWDNSPMESFFGSLKTEHIFFEKFKTRAEARQSIFEWIEVFYNRQRLHSSLGFLSPVDYEKAA